MIEHALELARLRARLVACRRALREAGIEPPADAEADALLDGYDRACRVATAVYEHLVGDGSWDLSRVPLELRDLLREEMIR